ncbi:hypothetical protein [Furfurilactobacillus siliginis]|uniref:Uncharacterized protein n=1 Tax=Furfurilactobacillus siliginis TaxID=348151 RepID=A0A510VPL6_9LACO|nr:hypothetical protein [Furfurilactobacillus siliginis]GEK28892.1 hypothetical protein LSI01_12030 [Furfurilactobacillus siliginis]
MKTRELEARVKNLGFYVKNHDGDLFIRSNFDCFVWFARVSTNLLNEMSMSGGEQITNETELFDLIVEYARTPLAEREEPKKYRARIPEISYLGEPLFLRKSIIGEFDTYPFVEDDYEEKIKFEFTKQEKSDAPSWIQPEWWEEVK